MKCEFCGLDPYEYIDGLPIAVNCCEAGYLVYDQGVDIEQVRKWTSVTAEETHEQSQEIDDLTDIPF